MKSHAMHVFTEVRGNSVLFVIIQGTWIIPFSRSPLFLERHQNPVSGSNF